MNQVPSNRRLEQLLGAPLSKVDAASLQRLCDGAVREDADLEFKEALYGGSDGDKRDLAGDVAAIANTRDGVIVIGVKDHDGAAAKLSPVALKEEEELRLRQVVASLVAPPPRLWVLRVPTPKDPSLGFYLLIIPRSPMAPHAVRLGEALRYPRREGASVRWLSESEVADAYRSRFLEARSQVDRLQQITEEGLRSLALDTSVWVVAALVPATPGYLEIRHRLLRQARESWVPRWSSGEYGRRIFAGGAFYVESGVRRIVISNWRDDETRKSQGAHVELHSDGSGFAGKAFVSFRRKEDEVFQVFDEGLLEAAVMLSGLLVEHALDHAGASGEAVMQLSLVGQVSKG
jgi:hypothetical protein